MDPRWEVASNTEIWTSDAATLAELAGGCYGVDQNEQIYGAVIAARHPTGWFVHALRSRWMSGHEARQFAEFVKVRVFLLLVGGARPQVWGASQDGSEWRAFSLARDAEAVGSVPDQLPATW
ncbi:MAG: hypothetical protein ABI934_08720 [Actinomycetota bacterium]